MDVIPLDRDILWIPGVFDPAICQHIIEIVNSRELLAAGILLDTVDTQIRSSDILNLGGVQPLLKSTNELLVTCLLPVQKLLHRYYGIGFYDMESISILRYQPGQFYQRHVDNVLLSSRRAEVAQGIPTRDLGIVGYLNGDFTGGETYFDRQNVTVKPEPGAVVVFPAYYTHPHQSLPVQSGVKYALTTWLFHRH
ncbi:Membrane-associated proteoglycan Leprecan [Gloeomargarita lithophora Alchichica-D10]|uniref:Membrane-associated proteoglycan Leprecan n=1 Tax=Gloeomargarita lithophora Alchichica-D10 TaxID=1188229 RepID=A0A1J0AH39_9CYAN|nr:2OG-Fe(II) oxygenase [Gloeomargarita lithophora]APB35258.1 Membrane-associated proteoglycan Leprecan [Gloeomargarita lithophora Alchichica-D10]